MNDPEYANQIWLSIATTLGYKTEADMLNDLYCNKQWSLKRIGEKLGYTHTAVRRRLFKHDIKPKARGGKNNEGKQRSILDRFDKEFVLKGKVKDVAFTAKVTEASVYTYRRKLKDNENGTDNQSGDTGDTLLATGQELPAASTSTPVQDTSKDTSRDRQAS